MLQFLMKFGYTLYNQSIWTLKDLYIFSNFSRKSEGTALFDPVMNRLELTFCGKDRSSRQLGDRTETDEDERGFQEANNDLQISSMMLFKEVRPVIGDGTVNQPEHQYCVDQRSRELAYLYSSFSSSY
ncbi:hypothetical protein AVEN_113956-1 [Araneus ventricosus]|uniref:Uncharacterized protein n=1 Tax=Araneus ventricosus TaxID=182803 RepID=A0A4Y2IV14_ARAVE|nr:hypothetical protein AVEN_113956-1 [Araneus ventricosus]